MREPDHWAWAPQAGPQYALVECPAKEVFFGGTRGGGKTDGVLGKWALKEKRYGSAFNAIMFRKTTVSAEDAIERSREIYGPLGGIFNHSKLRWRMPNGGRVGFAYLESVKDADQYQGRNVTDIWVEEAGLYETPDPIDRLFGVLRSAQDVPVQMILTGNPGGAGQHWICRRYGLVPFPRFPKFLTRKLLNGETHQVCVVPSRIYDNQYLGKDYINSLHMVGSAQLVKAWLDGDWTAIEGAFFDCWSEAKHVIPPFTIPRDWLRFRSMDWGSASPASVGWWAVVQDDFHLDRGAYPSFPRGDEEERDQHQRPRGVGKVGSVVLPRGALVRYREDYIADGRSHKGLKLTAELVADRIIGREAQDPKLGYGVLDPSTFKEDGGPPIAERINRKLLEARIAPFRPADNTRVSRIQSRDRGGPMSGWDAVRSRMIGIDGVPLIYCFSTCVDSIRTIPVLQHDASRAEDLDTHGEDHAADEWRYACLSRPWLRSKPEKTEVRDGYSPPSEEIPSDNVKTL